MSLTQEIIDSLSGYAFATRMERHCLYAIAARTQPNDLKAYQSAFDEIAHGDRWMTKTDLVESFLCAQRWCSTIACVDADLIFWAADLDGDAVLSFTEFVAGCLYSCLGPLDGWLLREAFDSMDKDGDGLLRAGDVTEFFDELPPGLPTHRPFDVEEWCACLLRYAPQRRLGDEKTGGAAQASMLPSLFGGCRCEPSRDENEVDVFSEVQSFSFMMGPGYHPENLHGASRFAPMPRFHLSSPSYNPMYAPAY
jgi:hypothetical protein